MSSFDHEHVPQEIVKALEAASVGSPGSAALEFAQDKAAMRRRLQAAKPGAIRGSWPAWRTWRTSTVPGLKVPQTSRGGYDGRGQGRSRDSWRRPRVSVARPRSRMRCGSSKRWCRSRRRSRVQWHAHHGQTVSTCRCALSDRRHLHGRSSHHAGRKRLPEAEAPRPRYREGTQGRGDARWWNCFDTPPVWSSMNWRCVRTTPGIGASRVRTRRSSGEPSAGRLDMPLGDPRHGSRAGDGQHPGGTARPAVAFRHRRPGSGLKDPSVWQRCASGPQSRGVTALGADEEPICGSAPGMPPTISRSHR